MASDKEKDQLRANLAAVTPVLEQEGAVLSLNAKKTLIVTDIHGNADILDFILKFGKEKGVDSYVFLGDYIDKGPDSVGVLNRLFELKLSNPNVALLRGNHETTDVSTYGEFRSSVSNEPDLFLSANAAFENMPIAAVLFGKIFCVHGGLTENDSISGISKSDSFGYLWNDPFDAKGWTPSPRGSRVKRFGPDVAKTFLKKNGLQLIIRGHITLETGVKFWFDKTLVSLYSALPYSGPDIKAAVCIADSDAAEFFFYRKDKKKNDFVWESKTSKVLLRPAPVLNESDAGNICVCGDVGFKKEETSPEVETVEPENGAEEGNGNGAGNNGDGNGKNSGKTNGNGDKANGNGNNKKENGKKDVRVPPASKMKSKCKKVMKGKQKSDKGKWKNKK
ncbi:hypothetical protein MsAg5_14000 [Methanosarcinaceae archaeon Ag5]|uniref:Serine/threonine specific protein phosphatases domain-containing protein n=1 Tax=Methanolapillus africanus TaxID=3028297 RepID=A0AAE4MKJ3_9EURY|nr:hypothetical protein [Methanosarcinaceae archaeon Ag5]